MRLRIFVLVMALCVFSGFKTTKDIPFCESGAKGVCSKSICIVQWRHRVSHEPYYLRTELWCKSHFDKFITENNLTYAERHYRHNYKTKLYRINELHFYHGTGIKDEWIKEYTTSISHDEFDRRRDVYKSNCASDVDIYLYYRNKRKK